MTAKAQVVSLLNKYFVTALSLVALLIFLSFFGTKTYTPLFERLGVQQAGVVVEGLFLALLPTISAFAVSLLFLAFFETQRRIPVVLQELGKRKKEPFITTISRWFIKNERLKKIRRWQEESIENDVLFSSEFESPVVVSTRYTALFLIALTVCVPFAVAGVIITKQFVFAGLLGLPVVFLFLPLVSYKNKKSDFSKALLDELPFFASIATIMSSAGLTLFSAFERVSRSPVFRAFRSESLIITRDVELFGRAPLDALNERARRHPNRMYASFLSGYTAIVKSGGSVETYLIERVREYLEWLSFRWRQYAEKTSFLGEMMILMFFLVPVFLILGSALGVSFLSALLPVLPVVFGGVLYSSVIANRPRYPDAIKANVWLPISLAAACSFAVFFVLRIPYLSIGLGLGVFAAGIAFQTVPQIRQINDVEETLPLFIRDLTEYRKVGYDVLRSLEKVGSEAEKGRAYRAGFKAVLRDFLNQLKLGRAVSQLSARTGSWLGRFVFFSVQALAEAGNVTPALLEQLHEFTYRFIDAKKRTKSTMNTFKIMGFLLPLMLSFTMLTAIIMLSSFSAGFGGITATGGIQTGGFGFSLKITQLQQQMIFVFIVLSSFVVGLVIDKAVEGTILSTTTALSAVAISLVVVAMFPVFRTFASSAFGLP